MLFRLVCLCALSVVVVVALVPSFERTALVDFYNSLDGPQWRNPKNWLTDDPCQNDWFGVGCDLDNSTVLELTSDTQGVKGTIPISLANLPNLSDFIMTLSPFLEGPVPPFYVDLQNFKRFEIVSTGITGDLPSQLGTVSTLVGLNLNTNSFTGTIPDDMFGVAPYIYLSLQSNKLSGSLPESLCKSQPSLRGVSVESNQMNGAIPDCFDRLPNITFLNLGNNQFTGTFPTSITKLPLLTYVEMYDNQLSGDLPKTFATSDLINFDISRNGLTGTIPDYSGIFTQDDGYFIIEDNQLTGLIPDWVCNLRGFSGEGNNFSCPVPSCCQVKGPIGKSCGTDCDN